MVKESNYIEISSKDIQHLYNSDIILVVTANELETEFTHKKIKPLSGYEKIIKVYEGDITLYLGLFGNYKIAHVQSSMGSISRDSSIMTVSTALSRTKARIVIMIGIAFGVNPNSQNFGDVLISESIIPYNPKRIGKETIKRGIEAPSSKILLNRFKNIKTTWEYILDEDKKAQLIPTRILSGEELIDNIEYRNSLIKLNPESKGGEMEGAGVYAACDGKADWMIVKGICDFADGNKGEKKVERQTIAINSALSACQEIFNSFSAFNELNVSPYITENAGTLNPEVRINDVLFDVYDNTKEPYYIEREEDDKLNSLLSQYSIWIYGPTGCGKSNLILRNLLYKKKAFIQLSLAACVGTSVDVIFNEILYEISAQSGTKSQIQPKSFQECSKAIIDILSNKYEKKDLIIFIEEIPLSSETNFCEFSNKIFSLLISKNLTGNLDKVKFALSSINNPINSIQLFQHKVHQQLSFIPLDYWNSRDINSLIDRIEANIGIYLPIKIKDEFIEYGNGSPRFIKKYFRSLLTINNHDEASLQYILKETHRELH